MSRNFKKALHGLKDTFPTPNPRREEEFFQSLPEFAPKRKKNFLPMLHMGRKSLWYAVPAVVTAALIVTVGTKIYSEIEYHPFQVDMYQETIAITTETIATTPEEMDTFNIEETEDFETSQIIDYWEITEIPTEENPSALTPIPRTTEKGTASESKTEMGSTVENVQTTAVNQQTTPEPINTTAAKGDTITNALTTASPPTQTTTPKTTQPIKTTATTLQRDSVPETANVQTTVSPPTTKDNSSIVLSPDGGTTKTTKATITTKAIGRTTTIHTTTKPILESPEASTQPAKETLYEDVSGEDFTLPMGEPIEPTEAVEATESEPLQTKPAIDETEPATEPAQCTALWINDYYTVNDVVQKHYFGEAIFIMPPKTEEIFAISDYIVYAEVTNIRYLFYDENVKQPMTEVTLKVLSVEKGDSQAVEDEIILYEVGGYVPLYTYTKDYSPENALSSVEIRHDYHSEIGDTYYYFLKKASSVRDDLPENYYFYAPFNFYDRLSETTKYFRWYISSTDSIVRADGEETITKAEFNDLIRSSGHLLE